MIRDVFSYSFPSFVAGLNGGGIKLRNLRRNQKKLYYALYLGKVAKYGTDAEGNQYEIGEPTIKYSAPVEFKGSISMSGSGYSEAVEFGLDLSDYNATLIVDKNTLPIDEKSLIWYESEPQTDDDGYSIPESADYSVVKVNKSLNVNKYVLKKKVK